jgi:uncharacterized surface protein with fasciclin (FAS1) repeats
MIPMKTFASLAAAAALAFAAAPALAASANLVEAASASPQHRTLVAAVQAAGLVDTLAGSGPFTVFAPNDAAFGRLPAGTVEALVRPENREALRTVLTYHVVAGRVSAADLVARIRQGNGSATLTTVQGGTLTARLAGDKVTLTDAAGGTATVVAADVAASNGLIHVTDAVSLPR